MDNDLAKQLRGSEISLRQWHRAEVEDAAGRVQGTTIFIKTCSGLSGTINPDTLASYLGSIGIPAHSITNTGDGITIVNMEEIARDTPREDIVRMHQQIADKVRSGFNKVDRNIESLGSEDWPTAPNCGPLVSEVKDNLKIG